MKEMERITYKGESVTFSIFRKRIASEYQKYRDSPKDYMEVTLTYDEYLEQELFLALKLVSGWDNLENSGLDKPFQGIDDQ